MFCLFSAFDSFAIFSVPWSFFLSPRAGFCPGNKVSRGVG